MRCYIIWYREDETVKKLFTLYETVCRLRYCDSLTSFKLVKPTAGWRCLRPVVGLLRRAVFADCGVT